MCRDHVSIEKALTALRYHRAHSDSLIVSQHSQMQRSGQYREIIENIQKGIPNNVKHTNTFQKICKDYELQGRKEHQGYFEIKGIYQR